MERTNIELRLEDISNKLDVVLPTTSYSYIEVLEELTKAKTENAYLLKTNEELEFKILKYKKKIKKYKKELRYLKNNLHVAKY